jgi:NAD(P)-dependent dehydrogenase (short-subunit alcohol dehydrogenase family)
MGMLDGKTAIVTGGARGIGFAIARRYIAEGTRVVIADIEESAGKPRPRRKRCAVRDAGRLTRPSLPPCRRAA